MGSILVRSCCTLPHSFLKKPTFVNRTMEEDNNLEILPTPIPIFGVVPRHRHPSKELVAAVRFLRSIFFVVSRPMMEEMGTHQETSREPFNSDDSHLMSCRAVGPDKEQVAIL
jgi:hypothetical protein